MFAVDTKKKKNKGAEISHANHSRKRWTQQQKKHTNNTNVLLNIKFQNLGFI